MSDILRHAYSPDAARINLEGELAAAEISAVETAQVEAVETETANVEILPGEAAEGQ